MNRNAKRQHHEQARKKHRQEQQQHAREAAKQTRSPVPVWLLVVGVGAMLLLIFGSFFVF
ncbi:MAG TPA: hypothetical protein VKE74_21765 [Gemmataceae bacterium]|nr:hypothetical protein [Gemmataceae bacterium]